MYIYILYLCIPIPVNVTETGGEKTHHFKDHFGVMLSKTPSLRKGYPPGNDHIIPVPALLSR